MDSDEGTDSDLELQVAFQKGLLKPGLNVEFVPQKRAVNDVKGMKQVLGDLQNNLPWPERLDMTVAPLPPPKPMAEQLGANPDDLSGDGVHDDFKREMRFYRQAQAAVMEGLPRLIVAGIHTRRPEDYFAEMAKTDGHMEKVRQKLLSQQTAMERSEKAKKLRDLRKYGKKVQHEVLLKRQKEKREMADAIKKFKKTGRQDKLDFLEDRTQTGKGKPGASPHQPNKKRMKKNQKYGFGGQKKRSKSNTKESARDMSGYNKKTHSNAQSKMNKKSGRPGNKNKSRPGKNRRAKNKARKK